MKIFFLLLFLLSCFCVNAQDTKFEDSVLQLSKNSTLIPVKLIFKSHKRITIKTADGKKFTLLDYTLIGDSAILSNSDTIALKNVIFVKGNVKGNLLRKISGITLKCAGGFFTIVGAVAGSTFLIPLAYLICIPAIGVGYVGHTLAGARSFDTSQKWTLKISPKPE